jgi:hypothetical protein
MRILLRLLGVSVALMSFSPRLSPAQESAVALGVPRYDLTVRIDPNAPRMDVSGTMRLRWPSAGEADLQLVLSHHMHDLTAAIVEPQTVAGPVELVVHDTAGGSTTWTVRSHSPIPAGQELLIRFACSGGEHDGVLFHLGPTSSFAGAQSVAWYPTTKDADGRATGSMSFWVPNGYTVVAPGTSRPLDRQGEGPQFTFDLSRPGFLSFAMAKYEIVRNSGPDPVSAYVLNKRPNIQDYVKRSGEVLSLLTKEFGPYPYGSFSIVEVPHDIAERAGFEGASFTGYILVDATDLDADFNLAFYGHEIGHQWWGNLVTLGGERGRDMLDEAMAQFGGLHVVETIEGAAAGASFRRDGYPGANWHQNGAGYLMFAAAGLDHPLDDMPGGVLAHELADAKGFLVLNLLSHTVGADRFRAILHTITQDPRNQQMTWQAFLDDIARRAGRNLDWFYDEWLKRAGAPSWNIRWTQVGMTLSGTITQQAPFYRSSVDVAVTGTGCRHTVHTVVIDGPETHFSWRVHDTVTSVQLDPEYLVPHWTPALRAEATSLAPALHAEITFWSGKLDDAKAESRHALANVATPDSYGARFMLEWILGQIAMRERQWTEARTHLEAALESPSRRPYSQMWVYIDLAMVGKELHDTALLRDVVNGAASTDALSGGRSGKVAAVRALAKDALTPE